MTSPAEPPEEARAAAMRALASMRGPELQEALAGLDAADPARLDADIQHARGRCLSVLGTIDDSIDAYERALELDPSHAASHYSLGLVLANQGRTEEAIAQWEGVGDAAPEHDDAAYNLGQACYTLGRFDDALRYWQSLVTAHPDRMDALKKCVQALHALGRDDEAEALLERLARAWQESHAPAAATVPEYVVVDQFRVGPSQVLAKQQISTPSGDPQVPAAFVVHGEDAVPLFAVQLESSAYGRERGTPYLVGILTRGRHRAVGPGWSSRPPYRVLRETAREIIAHELELKSMESDPAEPSS